MTDLYHELNHALQHAGALMDAAETHGILSGLICCPVRDELSYLSRHVLGEASQHDVFITDCQRLLYFLRDYTKKQFNADDLSFMPLLPDDDHALDERVQALGGWCEGFLFGLGLAGAEHNLETLSPDAREFLQDLLAFSRIAPQTDANNADESAYMQVLEYLRVGVLTLYENNLTLKMDENKANG